MPRKVSRSGKSSLRSQAEKAVSGRNQVPSELSPLDLQKLVVELRVHQAELEIQNEEMMRVQSELEESRSKYSDLYDFAPIGYFSLDRAGLILEVNLTGAALLGVERRNLKHHPFSHYVCPEYRPVYRSHLDEISRKQDKGVCELKLATSGGSFFARMESVSRFDEAAGRLLIRSAVTDVTDRKRMEEDLQSSYSTLEERVKDRTQELQQANRELEAFTYSVSHDLRSPLRAIQGFARMIEQEYGKELKGELLRKFQVIEESAARMGRLIDSLLEFSRLGRRDLQLIPIDMNRMLEEVVREIRQSESNRIHIETAKIPPAQGDPALVRQVIYNLLSNAVKFTSRRSKPAIKITGKRDGEFVVCCVKDNGAGFSMDYYGKLFGVFQRLHGPEYGGTGIGLAIVKKIIEKHGGKVWGEGAENKGATFCFSLPRQSSTPDRTRT